MTQPRGYVDADYLHVMAELVKQDKQRTYTWMHIQPGYAVLDVGCGPGTDTIVLAGLIGPTGRVVGVDSDAAMIAEADRRAEQAGCSAWCRHQQGDAIALPLETGAFDACRDADWGTLSIDTPEVDIERRIVLAHTERTLNNGYAGRQLYGVFKRQQFAEIAVEIRPWRFTNYALLRYLALMDTVERDALAAGLITEEELHSWQQSLKQAEAEGTFFAHINAVLVAGRKMEAARGQPRRMDGVDNDTL